MLMCVFKKNNKWWGKHCFSNSLLNTWSNTSIICEHTHTHAYKKNKTRFNYNRHIQVFFHTCVRRYITMVVRQEPQIKSTMLMNEWKRNARRRREEKRGIDAEGGGTYAYRTTTMKRTFFSFSLDKIFSTKKKKRMLNSSSILFHFWLLLLLLATYWVFIKIKQARFVKTEIWANFVNN